jgi:hypothetical protein
MSNTHAIHRPRPRAEAKTKKSQDRRDARELKELGCAIGRVQVAMYHDASEIASRRVNIDQLVQILDRARVLPHDIFKHHARLDRIRQIVATMIEKGEIVVGESGGFRLSSGLAQYQANVVKIEVARREDQEKDRVRQATGLTRPNPTAEGFSWKDYNADQLAAAG